MKTIRTLTTATLALGLSGCIIIAPGPSGGGGDTTGTAECTAHSDCDSVSICITGQCVLAAGRDYAITLYDTSIHSETNADGEAWDALGDAPDPYGAVLVDGQVAFTTPAVANSYTATWETVGYATLQSSSTFDVYVYDEDLAEHDLVDSGAFSWLQIVKDGGYSGQLSGGYASVAVFVDPL